MVPLFPINRFSTMSAARFQVSDQDNQDEVFSFNSFKGTYIGHDLLGHLTVIDPHRVHFDFVTDYIGAFPESKYFFEYSFPFYMGSHVTQHELVSFYEEHYCQFVEIFQMDHPDWHDYTNAECLSHFKTALHEYVNDIDDDDYYSNSIGQNMHQMTPNTLERPHFSVHAANNGNFVGFGYLTDNSLHLANISAFCINSLNEVIASTKETLLLTELNAKTASLSVFLGNCLY